MPTPVKQPYLAALVLLLAPRVAGAHIPLESTLNFLVRSTGIEVEIYMARGSADVLIAHEDEQVTIVRANFPEFQSRLTALGPALLSVAEGDGTVLKADAAAATLTDDNDICFHLHYPLPTALPGPLRIHGNYLPKMDEGHIADISVLNGAGEELGRGELRAESPDYVAHLPAAAALAAPPATDAAVTPAAPSPYHFHWGRWALLGVCALVIALVALRGIARPNGERQARP